MEKSGGRGDTKRGVGGGELPAAAPRVVRVTKTRWIGICVKTPGGWVGGCWLGNSQQLEPTGTPWVQKARRPTHRALEFETDPPPPLPEWGELRGIKKETFGRDSFQLQIELSPNSWRLMGEIPEGGQTAQGDPSPPFPPSDFVKSGDPEGITGLKRGFGLTPR